jgi:hypothetical protein
MTRHFVLAILFALAVGIYAVVMVWLAAVAIHGFKVIRIMLDARYGWRDSAYLLRRQRRQELGKPPGGHRVTAPIKGKPVTAGQARLALAEPEPVGELPEPPWVQRSDGRGLPEPLVTDLIEVAAATEHTETMAGAERTPTRIADPPPTQTMTMPLGVMMGKGDDDHGEQP